MNGREVGEWVGGRGKEGEEEEEEEGQRVISFSPFFSRPPCREGID